MKEAEEEQQIEIANAAEATDMMNEGG